MRHRSILSILLSAGLATAQAEAPAPTPAPLPGNHSAAATELLDRALDKMAAFGRGAFVATVEQESEVLKALGGGGERTEITGGWSQDLSWGAIDEEALRRCGGRVLVKAGKDWKLRTKRLPNGKPLPFLIEPNLLFTVVAELPPSARKVTNVGSGAIAGRKVTILTLVLDEPTSRELVECGVLPPVRGATAGFFFGVGQGDQPQSIWRAHLAFFVDPDNGDLLRLAVRAIETSPFGNVQIGLQAGGNAEAVKEPEDDLVVDPTVGAQDYKKGLPIETLGGSEASMLLTVRFADLGLVKAPKLDDRTRQLLRLR